MDRLPLEILGERPGRNEAGLAPSLAYASYIGGTGTDVVTAVAADADGFLWVAGYTTSTDLPVTATAVAAASKGGRDAFVIKLDPRASGLSSLVYATYLGGAGDEEPVAMVVRGNMVFLAGSTSSTDFPTAGNRYKDTNSGRRDSFVVKINTAVGGTAGLLYSSYVGGENYEYAYGLAVDSNERMYVTGYTTSTTSFPVTANPLQASNRGGYEAFLYVIDPNLGTGSSLVYSTYFGGSSTDIATGIALDASGKVYLTGQTMSDNFPVTGAAYQTGYHGKGDIFITRLDLTKSGLAGLDYSTYFGGGNFETAYGIAIDPAGNVCLTGYTMSSDFPVTPTAYQQSFGGLADVFVAKFDFTAAPGTMLYSTYLGGVGADIAYALSVGAAGRIYVTGYAYSGGFPSAGPPLQEGSSGINGAFLSAVDTSASDAASLLLSTHFGDGGTVGYGLAADGAGSLHVAGLTISTALPVTEGALSTVPRGATDGFVMKVDLSEGQPLGVLSRNQSAAAPRTPMRVISAPR
ncbi:MAG TPA: SBBP repeat-containing protein [Bryobacteraceae bacterium]|nr:SBBP repeat-containing protein [Bryobacteraceae bacterium]